MLYYTPVYRSVLSFCLSRRETTAAAAAAGARCCQGNCSEARVGRRIRGQLLPREAVVAMTRESEAARGSHHITRTHGIWNDSVSLMTMVQELYQQVPSKIITTVNVLVTLDWICNNYCLKAVIPPLTLCGNSNALYYCRSPSKKDLVN